MKQDEMIAEIIKNFKDISIPNKNSVINSDSSAIYEAIEIQEAFASLIWAEIELRFLLKHKAALDYLSDKAFVYFLPAYMKCIISDIDNADTLTDSLLGKLLLPIEKDIRTEYSDYLLIKEEDRVINLIDFYEGRLENIETEIHYFIKRTALLSIQQSRCVLRFLLYLKKHLSAYIDPGIVQSAIYRYWFRFHSLKKP